MVLGGRVITTTTMNLNEDVLRLCFGWIGCEYGLVIALVCKDWHATASTLWRRLPLSYHAWHSIGSPGNLDMCVTIPRRLPWEICTDEAARPFLMRLVEMGKAPTEVLDIKNMSHLVQKAVADIITSPHVVDTEALERKLLHRVIYHVYGPNVVIRTGLNTEQGGPFVTSFRW